uniref:hypothetical protein n=1 Tax=Parabacteroides distasonis TaxID=823 RepID=UPI0040273ABB
VRLPIINHVPGMLERRGVPRLPQTVGILQLPFRGDETGHAPSLQYIILFISYEYNINYSNIR